MIRTPAFRSALVGLVVVPLAAACGGSAPPANAPPHEEHHHDELGEAHRFDAKLPPAIKDFHDVLAPLWHAPKGADRANDTCAKASTLKERAVAVQSAPPPDNAGDAWKDDARKLVTATDALASTCRLEGKPQFEERFSDVHDRFHRLTERIEH